MTNQVNQEAFEKWFGETYNDLQFNKAGMIDAWQAATQASESEINSLKQRVEELELTVKKWQENSVDLEYKCLDKNLQIAELQADNNQLREALSDTNTRFNEMVDVFYKGATAKDRAVVANNYDLLSATTSSLVEHDNDVIERIATALENADGEFKYLPDFVALVRALRVTP